MRAMVFAAGLGTRLRPLTDDRPKALVEVGGRTMIDRVLARLRHFGIHQVIINTHYFAENLAEYLRANQNFGMEIVISHEETLLDTGGGLKHARHFFENQSEPFLVHNVDVLSTIDFGEMLKMHNERDALATLAVQDRSTSRYLLFDDAGRLCGRRAGKNGEPEFVRRAQNFRAMGFCGIHLLSPRIFAGMQEEGVFSIIPVYLRLAARQEDVIGFSVDAYYWRDLGRPEDITRAEDDMRSGRLSGE